jgi:hypothetical protein
MDWQKGLLTPTAKATGWLTATLTGYETGWPKATWMAKERQPL